MLKTARPSLLLRIPGQFPGPRINEMHALASGALHRLIIFEDRWLIGCPRMDFHASRRTCEEERAHPAQIRNGAKARVNLCQFAVCSRPPFGGITREWAIRVRSGRARKSLAGHARRTALFR